MIRDLVRLSVQGAIISPLSKILGGDGGGLQSVFDLIFSGGGPGSLPAAAGFAESIPGFSHGGSFTVGGPGGTDRAFVGFMATRGEEVEVTPPGRRRGSQGGVTQIWNISTPDVDGFRRSQGQLLSRAAAGIARVQGKG